MNKVQNASAEPEAIKASAHSPEKQKARLKNWAHHRASEIRQFPHMTGNVYDHPKLNDGEFVFTSHLVWFDRKLRIAETKNTVYILEGPPA